MEKTFRVGLGYDLHRLIVGRDLILGGVKIPSEKGEDGHSDGDALLHAICDSLLGAAAKTDIGERFPDADARFKNADSAELLRSAWRSLFDEGWRIENIDCVVSLEKPKILPHRAEICRNIAKILEISAEKVFVKAKTGEKLGDIGENRAVCAWANCLLSKF